MAYEVEDDELNYMMDCPDDDEGIRANIQNLFDCCEGDVRKLMCHLKRCVLANLVHKMRSFRDENTKWLFDFSLVYLRLVMFIYLT